MKNSHHPIVRRAFRIRPRVRTIALAVIGFIMLVNLSACSRVHRFHVVRYKAETTSDPAQNTSTETVTGKGRNLQTLSYDNAVITFQRAYAYAPWDKNPGVAVTLLIENRGDTELIIPSHEIVFNRFPPEKRSKGNDISPVLVTVEPGIERDGVWILPQNTTAKVHLVFRSPARTPGYLTLHTKPADAAEEKVFTFKITRIPPTNS